MRVGKLAWAPTMTLTPLDASHYKQLSSNYVRKCRVRNRSAMNQSEIKELLIREDPSFWIQLDSLTGQSTQFDELICLSSLRKRALARGFSRPGSGDAPLRLAILGGCSLYPLHEVLTHLLDAG